jgi:YD repeat-containing protein
MLPFQAGRREVTALAFVAGGVAALGDGGKMVWLWDVGAPAALPFPPPEAGVVFRRLAASPDGGRLALAERGSIWVRAMPSRRQALHVRVPTPATPEDLTGLTFTADGAAVVACWALRPFVALAAAVLWDATSGAERFRLTVEAQAGGLACSPDGRFVLIQQEFPFALRLEELTADEADRPASIPLVVSQRPTATAFGPPGDRLALSVGREVLVFAAPDWSLRWRLTGHHDAPIRALAFTPDGVGLLSGSRDRQVRLWDLTTGRQRASWQWRVGSVFSLAVAPDGLTAAVGGSLGRCVLWDLDG